MKTILSTGLLLALLAAEGCTPRKPSPTEVRQWEYRIKNEEAGSFLTQRGNYNSLEHEGLLGWEVVTVVQIMDGKYPRVITVLRRPLPLRSPEEIDQYWTSPSHDSDFKQAFKDRSDLQAKRFQEELEAIRNR